jgi:hypothetical protein
MTLLSKLNLKPLVLLLALVALSATLVWAAPDQPIGEAARQRTEELANAPAVTDPQAALNQYLTLVWGLTAVVVVLMLVMVQNVMRLTGFDPFKTWNTNEINPRLMIAFLVLGGLALAYEWALHGKYALVGDSASAHGVEIDNMLITSLALTGIAFIIVQVLLFGYAYLYRARPGRKAIFWHDSQPLELGLAGITAVGLAFLVLGGVRVWTDIHAKPSAEALQIELVGEQVVEEEVVQLLQTLSGRVHPHAMRHRPQIRSRRLHECESVVEIVVAGTLDPRAHRWRRTLDQFFILSDCLWSLSYPRRCSRLEGEVEQLPQAAGLIE